MWFLAEYLLHRFAMHLMRGKGIMSREHLLHHVSAGWGFGPMMLLSWIGMLLAGAVVWAPLTWWLVDGTAAIAIVAGWAVGYFFYEYQHAVAHLRAPSGRYSTWLRRHHFHHHFGHPMANHGVSLPLWDIVFGTFERPERVRVPRRFALAWLVDETGELRPDFCDDYVLVGSAERRDELATIDRTRAFASEAPLD